MKIEFVNRTSEFAFLDQRLLDVGVENSIVLVSGESGVGKSELTKVFIDYSINKLPCIKVPIQQAEKNAYSSGYYLTKLAQLLNEAAKSDDRIRSLSSFFKLGNQSSVLNKKAIDNLAEDVSSLLPFSKTFRGLFDLVFAKGELDESKFFQSTHSDVLSALFEYVRYQLATTPMIVNFENIQSVDERSLELFSQILQTSKQCLFILEFTQNDNSGYSFSELTNKLEENKSPIYSLYIPPLNINDVKRIIESQPDLSWDIMQHSYVNWNGNVRLLIDVLAKHRYGLPIHNQSSINLLDATKLHLASLIPGDLFLLIVIESHNEPVQKSILKQLIKFKDAFSYILDIESSLENLDRHYLLKFNGDEIQLAHDSIKKELERLDRYMLFSTIAHRFWAYTYEILLNKGDVYTAKGWILMKVLYFSSLLGHDEKILSLLDLINEEAVKSRDPLKMIKYVEEVKQSLVDKDNVKYGSRITAICLWLVELWYNLGHSKKAWQQLQGVSQQSKKSNVLRAILLEQIGRHADVIQYCTEEINGGDELPANYELSLRLVRLITNYALGNSKATSDEFYFLYENEKYSSEFEYGFLLRNAELLFSYEDSLPYFLLSIEHFKKFNAVRQASFSRITYGVHLGLTGQLDRARSQFKLAGDELDVFNTERHSILNNLAVLLLFEKKISDETGYLFRQAIVESDSDFENVAILNNYLVLLDWQDKRLEAESAITSLLRILEKPSFASKEIIRYAYFNIYRFYNRLNKEEAASFLHKITSLGLEVTPIWKFWLYGEPIPSDDEEYFLSVIDRPISFLCNWNMEFDSKLMRYE